MAIRPSTEPGGCDGVWTTTDGRPAAMRPEVPAEDRVACGRSAGFGASTVTEGSGETEPELICDSAVPLAPHRNAADRRATADDAKKPDDDFMTKPHLNGTETLSPHHDTMRGGSGNLGTQ